MSLLALIKRRTGTLGWWVVGILISTCQPVSAQSSPTIQLVRGEVLYINYCSACHGIAGDGVAAGAFDLTPPPRDFTTGVYKFRSTKTGSLPTDADLERVITLGIPQTWMPAWGQVFDENQMDDIISYIKSLLIDERGWVSDMPLPMVNPIETTAEMLEDGEALYLMFECWKCHGIDGRGGGPSSNTLLDYKQRSIEVADLTHPDYKIGTSAQDIRRTLLTGLAGTPMPAYEEIYVMAREDLQEITFESLPPAAAQKVQDYIAKLPISAELDMLSEEQWTALAQKNQWALVIYVQSFIRKKNWFYWAFRATP